VAEGTKLHTLVVQESSFGLAAKGALNMLAIASCIWVGVQGDRGSQVRSIASGVRFKTASLICCPIFAMAAS
jgi:hypothetical protein